MNRFLPLRTLRTMSMLAVGSLLLQTGGCNFLVFNEIVQTILLGITAAGGYAILRNI